MRIAQGIVSSFPYAYQEVKIWICLHWTEKNMTSPSPILLWLYIWFEWMYVFYSKKQYDDL